MRIILTLLMALMVSACATKPEVRVVQKTTKVYTPIPEQLMVPCPIPVPVEKQKYLQMDFVEKEITLTNYTVSLLKALGKCNLQLKYIREFNERMIRETDQLKTSSQVKPAPFKATLNKDNEVSL